MPKFRPTDDHMDGAREKDQRIRRRNKPGASASAYIFQCQGKLGYGQALAKHRARKIDSLVAYPCTHCKFWHVGNKSRNSRYGE